MGSELLDIKQQVVLQRFLQALIEGEATSIEGACEVAGINKSTLYDWQRRGLLDGIVAQMRANISHETVALLASRLPEILEDRIQDALAEDKSTRDKNDTVRVILRALKELCGSVGEAVREREPAQDWLARRGGEFPSVIQIAAQGDVHIEQQREPGDHSPILVSYDYQAVKQQQDDDNNEVIE